MTHDYMKSMISYLLNRRDFVSGQELSEALGVSTKTINRTVKQINGSSEEIPIIESQRGRGYRLNFQNYFNQQDRMDHANAMNGISSVERRDEIIKRPLITSPHQYRVDDTGAKVVVLLTVGANGDGSNEHLRLLSPLARKMAKQESPPHCSRHSPRTTTSRSKPRHHRHGIRRHVPGCAGHR